MGVPSEQIEESIKSFQKVFEAFYDHAESEGVQKPGSEAILLFMFQSLRFVRIKTAGVNNRPNLLDEIVSSASKLESEDWRENHGHH